MIIALRFTEYQPDRLLQLFTNHFKQNYGMECIAALHHNKRKDQLSHSSGICRTEVIRQTNHQDCQ